MWVFKKLSIDSPPQVASFATGAEGPFVPLRMITNIRACIPILELAPTFSTTESSETVDPQFTILLDKIHRAAPLAGAVSVLSSF
jgi:hypothetical protein